MIRTASIALLLAAGQALASQPSPETDRAPRPETSTRADGRPSSLVQRPAVPARRGQAPRGGFPDAAQFPNEFRAIDGWGNNPASPWWGSVGMEMLRKGPNAYDDGVGEMPARSDGPSPRLVSNTINAQTADIPNTAGATDYLWQWGQFVDHDIDETPIASPGVAMDIAVPTGDPWFDPGATGTQTIAFDRSAFNMVGGIRQQMNNITAYIDASNVYGSDSDRARALRTLDGTGRLKTTAGDLLTFNTEAFPNAPTDHDPTLFLAGDVRCNEQAALTCMHTLFTREHNHHADRIRGIYPSMPGEEVYERARAIVAAEMQVITYNEFLPLLIGPDAIPPYSGYNPTMDAGIGNVFATAAYRVGHTMLSSTLRRIDANGDVIGAGHLALANAFFNPQHIIDEGIDPILRGLASQPAQDIDVYVIDDIRNFLFGAPGSGGFDLASLNIQRGRDHGVPGINTLRVAYGLAPLNGFADLTPDTQLQADLASLYDTLDEADPWVALLAEPHAPGALVGETLQRILGDQFTRLRDGDRFWYQAYLPPMMRHMVEQQTLAKIIRRNTGIDAELPDDVFRLGVCVADLTGDGVLDLDDLQLFVASFTGGDPIADLNSDGVYDLADVQGFIAAFNSGCP
jgi:hypothetical protein